MLTLYKALVLPVVEYCSQQLWSPNAVGEIEKLEGVQRSFTARLADVQNLNHWERLAYLSLYSLQRRRERYQIIYTWKMIRGLVPNFVNDELKMRTPQHIRRGKECMVPAFNNRSPASIRSMHERSFAVIGPRLFNCLPRELRDFEGTLETFKSKLDVFLKTIPDKPPVPHYYQPAEGNSVLQQLAYLRAQVL
jgi:hypothetical protein